MKQVKAIVLRAAGINCDLETEYALELAGAEARRVHINRIIEDKKALDQFQIIVFPGGFSYGDDVAAGKILANQIVHHLYEPIQKFIDDGKLVLGICNGFQVLVKAGILPGDSSTKQQGDVTITYNDSGKFEDRWVYLAPQTEKCISIAGLADTTGRVLGLMPHPERHVRPTQHPHWSRHESRATSHELQTADGMTIFNNAVKYIQENF